MKPTPVKVLWVSDNEHDDSLARDIAIKIRRANIVLERLKASSISAEDMAGLAMMCA